MSEVQHSYLTKFQNRLYGLLREREKERDWEGYLDTLLIEVEGFPPEMQGINYIMLKNKMYSLRILRYDLFRKTIFDCVSLLNV